MSNLKSAEDVRRRIAELKHQTEVMEIELKRKFSATINNLKPGNLIKTALTDLNETVGLKSTLFSTLLNLGLNFAGGKMLLGKGGIAQKAAGAALHYGAGKLLSRELSVLKRFALRLFTKDKKAA
ncbi:MAG: hypothetical protein JST63_04740 [Bacteroidetes bacterium]|nr:hypothetical protein [Bacteroidota bacterium]